VSGERAIRFLFFVGTQGDSKTKVWDWFIVEVELPGWSLYWLLQYVRLELVYSLFADFAYFDRCCCNGRDSNCRHLWRLGGATVVYHFHDWSVAGSTGSVSYLIIQVGKSRADRDTIDDDVMIAECVKVWWWTVQNYMWKNEKTWKPVDSRE
jgi:hypothetical protein